MSHIENDSSFPRNQWPRASYFSPGMRDAGWDTTIRFAAQRADAERREHMILGCVDCLWIKLDTDEWFKTSDRSAYQVDEVHMLVEPHGPDEADEKRYWPGFVVTSTISPRAQSLSTSIEGKIDTRP